MNVILFQDCYDENSNPGGRVAVVGNFQSAIQLVAGANLALFGLPNLRQPALEEETGKWVAMTGLIRPSESGWTRLGMARLRFLRLQRELDQKNSCVRVLSLWFAALYAGLLVWTSIGSDRPTDGRFLTLASLAGAVPALIWMDLNAKARSRLATIKAERLKLELIIMSPSN